MTDLTSGSGAAAGRRRLAVPTDWGPPDTPHVVILGGGFAGLHAARALGRAPVRVTVVDRQNYHLFQPLLYQVAAAVLSPGDIASPIRWLLRRQPNARVLLAEAQYVDVGLKNVELDAGTLGYDYLIVATGARHGYFGHPEWEQAAPGLKNLDDALEIRRQVLLAFEKAELAIATEERARLLTFVVIGGGPTGVEMAGALGDIARHALVPEYRRIDPASVRIVLLEAAPVILAGFPEALRASAGRTLERLGVEVHVNSPVTGVQPGAVLTPGGQIPAGTMLWAAGIEASRLGRSLGVETDPAGRVRVEVDLSVPGRPDVFVVGDLSLSFGPDGKPLPGVAAVAIQQGRHAAQNIIRALRSDARRPFRYRDRGNMAVIGRRSAIADFGRIRLSGRPGWIAWLVVHLIQLIGFRSRVMVLIQWAWSYFTYQRNVRLITGGPDGPTRARAGRAAVPPGGTTHD
jgi:NADH:ubiquinone reductase (H+-translocating)